MESAQSRWGDFLHLAPLLPAAVGLVMGIALDHAVTPLAWSYSPALTLAAAAVVWPGFIRGTAGRAIVVATAALACGGVIHQTATRILADDSVARFVQEPAQLARIHGRVASPPQLIPKPDTPFAQWSFRGDRTAFLLDTSRIEGIGSPVAISGGIRVTVREPLLDLRMGEPVEVFGWLYGLRPPQNPGAFDWARFQRRQGVVAGFICEHRESVRRLDPAFAGTRSLFDRLRAFVRGLLTADLLNHQAEEASLLEAMVLGHRSQLDRRLNEVFTQAGCIHFLAVSGTHVMILLSFVWFAGRLVGLTRRRCAWVTLVAIVAYMVIAEPRPPILRAGLMGMLFCVSLLLGRSRSHLNWLSAAAIVLLVMRPGDLFDIGFQLSFLAVLGVVYLAPALRNAVSLAVRRQSIVEPDLPPSLGTGVASRLARALARRTGEIAAVSVAAWLMGLPVIAAQFGRVQLWGWLSSIVVFPLVYLVMFLGVLKTTIGGLLSSVASWMSAAMGVTNGWLIGCVEFFAAFPAASVDTRPPPWWMIASAYLFLGAFLVRFRARRAPHFEDRSPVAESATKPVRGIRIDTGCLIVAAVVLCVCLSVWAGIVDRRQGLRMTTLAVGAGLAVVLELPDGRNVMYDSGSSTVEDVGRRTVVPFLRNRGIRKVDRLFVSHTNLDHYNGIPAVVDAVETALMVIHPWFAASCTRGSACARLLDEVNNRSVHVETLDTHPLRWQEGDVTFELLWPVAIEATGLSSNDASIVLRVSYGGRSILLTGDIEKRAQAVLLERGELEADVLVLPHHGSMRTTLPEFIRATGAQVLVKSSHQRSNEIPGKAEATPFAGTLLNTADEGAVMVELQSEGVQVWTAAQPTRRAPATSLHDS